MIFLAADIGGSRARLVIGETTPAGWNPLRQEILPSPEYPDCEALLARFLRPGEGVTTACLALAGPVDGDTARMTNLPWRIDAARLGSRFGLRRVRLVNDFAAQAHGLVDLTPPDLHTLQAGEPLAGAPQALLGAGTGLGMALLVPGQGREPVVLASEGGHTDFAPADDTQLALLRHLRPSLGRVSLEAVLSGPGLERIHHFLAGASAPTLSAEAIGTAAAAGEPMAVRTLELFARIYASAAANLALTVLPRGGVYLCGGIAPRILPFLAAPTSIAAFRHKPPMDAVLSRIPVHVVIDELLGLRGAASLAARLVTEPA